MSTFDCKLDPLDPKYGVNLETYPNDKEKTWSFPAERDGFVNYCINRLINNNLCSNTTRHCVTFLLGGT